MKKRKCRCCNKMFVPDKRNYWKQEYCEKPECRKGSKRHSQKKWSSKPENMNWFKGYANVFRVQQWRLKNPGYWKRGKKKGPLQDFVKSQLTPKKQDIKMNSIALQDFMKSQVAILIGIIIQFTGHALQDDIVSSMKKMIQKGLQILEPQTS